MLKASKTYVLIGLLLIWSSVAQAQSDPLPSWNDGPNKKSIIEFVSSVSIEGGPDFVPVPQRIATFDNDGTLWAEQPIYFQFAFALDRVKALGLRHPEWKTQQSHLGRLDKALDEARAKKWIVVDMKRDWKQVFPY